MDTAVAAVVGPCGPQGLPKLNILISYPYWRPVMGELLRQIPPETVRLFLDCGAFTAWKAGKTVERNFGR